MQDKTYMKEIPQLREALSVAISYKDRPTSATVGVITSGVIQLIISPTRPVTRVECYYNLQLQLHEKNIYNLELNVDKNEIHISLFVLLKVCLVFVSANAYVWLVRLVNFPCVVLYMYELFVIYSLILRSCFVYK